MKKLLIIALLGLFTTNIKSQMDVKANFNIFLDHKFVETDSVYISLSPYGNYTKSTKITNSFVTYFKKDCVYNVAITHPGYQRQVLSIDTHGVDNELYIKLYLKKGEAECYDGYYSFNK